MDRFAVLSRGDKLFSHETQPSLVWDDSDEMYCKPEALSCTISVVTAWSLRHHATMLGGANFCVPTWTRAEQGALTRHRLKLLELRVRHAMHSIERCAYADEPLTRAGSLHWTCRYTQALPSVQQSLPSQAQVGQSLTTWSTSFAAAHVE